MSEVQNTEPVCPYCGFVFETMPSRQRNCPSCKNTVYRKKRPTDRTLRLVTEQQANEIEKEWEERDRLRVDSEFNLLNAKLRTSTNHHDRKMAYLGLSIYYWRKGPEFREGLIECQRGVCVEELSAYLELGVNHVKIKSSPNTCQNLTIDHDEIFTIANALALMPIPHTGSDDGLCQCYYEEVFDDELPPSYVMPRPVKIRLNHDYPASNSVDSEHEGNRLPHQTETIAQQGNEARYIDPVNKWFKPKGFIWIVFVALITVLLAALVGSYLR